MSEAVALKADLRETIGHANRKLAAEGLIPAVLYGAGREPMAISISRHDFELYMSHHGAAGVMQLELSGEKKPVNALIKDVQYAPVKGNVVHIDFLAVRMDVAIASVAPLNFINDPVGVREGGVLTVALHEVNLEALPSDLPESIEVDVAELQIGESLHVSDIAPPSGVTLLDDAETVIASVTPPTVAVEEEAAEVIEGEEAEPEVIGESAEESEE